MCKDWRGIISKSLFARIGGALIVHRVTKMEEIKGVLLDLSGVLYVGEAALPGAVDALQRLRDLDLQVRFITNTTRSPRRLILAKLAGMGLELRSEELFTAPAAVLDIIRQRGLRPWLLIHPDLEEEFEGLDGQQSPNAVVLGDAGQAFDYRHLNAAFRLLMDGAEFLAMGNNRYFQEPEGLSLDIGPFVAALEYATGREAQVLGKPSALFFHQAVSSMGLEAGEVLMVGDDVQADVQGALAAGLQAALVQTGKYRPGDEDCLLHSGAWVAADFPSVVDRLTEA